MPYERTNEEIAREIAHQYAHCMAEGLEPQLAADIASAIAGARAETKPPTARPLSEWHEDIGDVLWWKFPIDEPPYVGSPLDTNWPGYHTHWTRIPVPAPPKDQGEG